MALQSALNKLRTGEKLDNTPARQVSIVLEVL